MKCNNLCKILFGITGILVLSSFLFPLWSYFIVLPLYPEGLNFHIYANKFAGNINSINTLNHYTGLAPLDPKSFPELKIIPVILMILGLFAIIVAVLGNRILALAWFVLFALFGVIGLIDFYLWLYRYGHNVNPKAPLAIEPQTLTMIGIKRISTITIYAYPNIGALLLLLAALLSFVGIVLSFRIKPAQA
jgi:copper chaperone NosL